MSSPVSTPRPHKDSRERTSITEQPLATVVKVLVQLTAAAACVLTTFVDVYACPTAAATSFGMWWMGGVGFLNSALCLAFASVSALAWRKRTMVGYCQAVLWLAIAIPYLALSAWNGLGVIAEQALGTPQAQRTANRPTTPVADALAAEILRDREELRAWLQHTYAMARSETEKARLRVAMAKAAVTAGEVIPSDNLAAIPSGPAKMATRPTSRAGLEPPSEEDAFVTWAMSGYLLILFGKLIAPAFVLATWSRPADTATVAKLPATVANPPTPALRQSRRGSPKPAIARGSVPEPLPQSITPVSITSPPIRQAIGGSAPVSEPSTRVCLPPPCVGPAAGRPVGTIAVLDNSLTPGARCEVEPATVGSLRERFPQLIPAKPYCANDPTFGLKIRSREEALRHDHIQLNGPRTFRWMLFDIDDPEAYRAHRDAVLPPPNIIMINPDNGHAHCAYLLAHPVARHAAARAKPLQFLAAVERGLARRLKADRHYRGLITKNPLHPRWRVEWRRQEAYTLEDLAGWLFREDTRPEPTVATTWGAGRNCTLFGELRAVAYREVLPFKRSGAFDAFRARLEDVAFQTNMQFRVALKPAEVRAIAKSVAKWTWRQFSVQRLSQIQSVRGARGAAKRWQGHISAERTKPWAAEGVSRSTWYRRRKARLKTH